MAPPTPTLAGSLYDRLKYGLMTGAFRPGQKLSIRRLADELGTGIMPVREALSRLASERALESLAKRSYVVPRLDEGRAADLFDLRALLESEAAVAAMAKIAGPELAALRLSAERTHAAIADGLWDLYMVENHRFHFLLYRMSGNADMTAMIEQLWMQTGPTLRQGLEGIRPDATWTVMHEALLEAIKNCDAASLRADLLQDIRWNWTDF